tara:strand:- start:3134 stop:4672 length:1539 start_codon:yes stop_codon:yes gene_type:complete
MIHIKTFFKNFGLPEFQSIVKNRSAIFLMLVISYLSLWSIGFSKASTDYLSEKMNSPFVEYISIEIPHELASKPDFEHDLRNSLNSDSVQSIFGIEGFDFLTLHSPYFYKYSSENAKRHQNTYKLSLAQITTSDDPFLKFIREEEDLLISGNPKMARDPWSVIVTYEFLRDLGYKFENSAYPSYVFLDLEQVNGEDNPFPLPISGIVKRLPNNIDVLIKPDLFRALVMPSQKDNPLWMQHPDHENSHVFYFDSKDVNDTINLQNLVQNSIIHLDTITHNFSGEGYLIDCADSTKAHALMERISLDPSKALRVYNPINVSLNLQSFALIENSDKDMLVVKLNDLTKVESFEKWCKSKNLSINMSDIEDRSNFQLFYTLSIVLAGFLSFVCIAFVITILSRTIIQHLDKNSKNLGTLKAFGLSNRNIIVTYSTISGLIIFVLFHVTLFLIYLFGNQTSSLLIYCFSLDMPVLFDLSVNYKHYLYFVLVPISFVSLNLYFRIRTVTPGDLIYERD